MAFSLTCKGIEKKGDASKLFCDCTLQKVTVAQSWEPYLHLWCSLGYFIITGILLPFLTEFHSNNACTCAHTKRAVSTAPVGLKIFPVCLFAQIPAP